MSAGSHVNVGEEHFHDKINRGEIYPGKLHHGGPRDTSGVDIFATCDEKNRIRVRGNGKSSLGIFLPSIFFGKPKSIPSTVGTLSKFLVKKAVLDLQNPVTSADERFLSSRRSSTELIRTMRRESEFSTADHI